VQLWLKNPDVSMECMFWQAGGYPGTVPLTGLGAGNVLPREHVRGKGHFRKMAVRLFSTELCHLRAAEIQYQCSLKQNLCRCGCVSSMSIFTARTEVVESYSFLTVPSSHCLPSSVSLCSAKCGFRDSC